MGAAGAESPKPVLSLTAVTSFMMGGYFFGERVGDQCIFYMDLADVKALATWLVCVVVSGGIGAGLGLLLNKYYIVKK